MAPPTAPKRFRSLEIEPEPSKRLKLMHGPERPCSALPSRPTYPEPETANSPPGWVIASEPMYREELEERRILTERPGDRATIPLLSVDRPCSVLHAQPTYLESNTASAPPERVITSEPMYREELQERQILTERPRDRASVPLRWARLYSPSMPYLPEEHTVVEEHSRHSERADKGRATGFAFPTAVADRSAYRETQPPSSISPSDGRHSPRRGPTSSISSGPSPRAEELDAHDGAQNEAVLAVVTEGRRLYIGNLAYATTEGDLDEFFKGYRV